MRVVYSQVAQSDLVEIGGHIALDSERHAEAFVESLRAKAQIIALAPRIYRLRPDLGAELRSVAIGDYIIIFRLGDSEIEILHIVHGARDLKRLFEG